MAKQRGMPNEWSDFPRRRAPEGWLCRWCGKALPKGKSAWCGPDCQKEVLVRCDWPYLRRLVRRRDRWKCVLCGKGRREGRRLEVDHITELQDGGQTVMENLRTLCLFCHRAKTAAERLRRKLAKAVEPPKTTRLPNSQTEAAPDPLPTG